MRSTLKKILYPVLKPLAAWHFRKPRTFKRDDLKLVILPSVFHPGIYLSTSILVDFVTQLPIHDKALLELGAGSGYVSFIAAKKGANVTASDINPVAIDGLQKNAAANQIDLNVVQSDLFEHIDPNTFDYIIINPPYYPQSPTTHTEAAFYCGEEFDYFKHLFEQLNRKLTNKSTETFIILSEDCDLAAIKSIAHENRFALICVHEEKKMQERNYIFKLARHE